MKHVKHQCKTSLKQHLARVTVLTDKIITEQSWEQSNNWAELRTIPQLCRTRDNPTTGQSREQPLDCADLGTISQGAELVTAP